MNEQITKAHEKLSGLKSVLEGYEDRRKDAQDRLESARASLAEGEKELFELRVQAVLDESSRALVPARQKAAGKQRELIEALEIEGIALDRKIGELRSEVEQAQNQLRKVRNVVLLEKIRQLRGCYSSAVAEAMQNFEFISVAVWKLTQDGGKNELKALDPALLQFPPASLSDDIGAGAPSFPLLECNVQGILSRAFPQKMTKEKREEILGELLK